MQVADVAGKEFSIEQALDKMQHEWEGTEMQVLDYRETKTYVVKVRMNALKPCLMLCSACMQQCSGFDRGPIAVSQP